MTAAFHSRTCPLNYSFDAGAAFPTVVISLYSNLQAKCQYMHSSTSSQSKSEGGNRHVEARA